MREWVNEFLSSKGTVTTILTIVMTALVTFVITKFQEGVTSFLKSFWYLITGRQKNKRFERQYLNRLVQDHQFLGLIPAYKVVPEKQGFRRTNLEQIYTTLRLSAEDEKQGSEIRIAESTVQRMKFSKRPKPVAQEIQLGSIIEKNDYILLKGDPGSGKSTILKYLVISCARALRADRREGDERGILKKRLGWKKKRFPIFISLVNLKDWNPEEPLSTIFRSMLHPEESKECSENYFSKKLEKGNCLILLDGLDELGSEQARNDIAERVGGLVNSCKGRGNKIVATTRIVGYEDQLAPYNFFCYKVLDLDPASRHRLVHQRFEAIALTESQGLTLLETKAVENEYQLKADDLIQRIQENEHLEMITYNPLLLTLIVMIFAADIEIPSQRHELYSECVYVLADRWGKKRSLLLKKQNEVKPTIELEDKKRLLAALAFEMQQRREELQKQSLLPRKQVEKLFTRVLKDEIKLPLPDGESDQGKYYSSIAVHLLNDIRDQHGILIEKGFQRDMDDALIAFSHLSFQEYLAAWHIKESGQADQLQNYLTHPAWAEVVKLYRAMTGDAAIIRQLYGSLAQPQGLLLAAACKAENAKGITAELAQSIDSSLKSSLFDSQNRLDVTFLQAICVAGGQHNLNWVLNNLEDKPRHRKAILRELAETPLRVSDKTFVAKRLLSLWPGSHLSLEDKINIGRVIDLLGDPRFSDPNPPMIRIPEGIFLFGDPKKEKRTNSFYIGQYPVTNFEYKKFVDDADHKPPEHWKDNFYPVGTGNHPVVHVTWHDSLAFCQWLSQKTGAEYRLPTEIEWEKASRGDDGRIYPWGDEFQKERCNGFGIVGSTSAVGLFADGKSPFGLDDCSGNVWEWTSSVFEQGGLRRMFAKDKPRVLRGGSWIINNEEIFRCAYRYRYYPYIRNYLIGFRVARSA
jgi:formylglycine-generating enzyme required for sulfatase activity